MPKQLRYHIYPLWMWLIFILFIVLSVYVIYLWQPGGVTPIRSGDTLIALSPLLVLVCFLVRLFCTHNGGSCFETLVILSLALLASLFLMPNFGASVSQSRWTKDRDRLKTIGVALHVYNQKYGSFPPAERFNTEKNTAENWQTILIENLGRELRKSDLRTTNKQDEPNYYFVVVGENTAWPPDGRKVQLQDIADPANTAVAIGIFDPDSKSPLAKENKIPLDDLLSGKVSWEKEIAVYSYLYDRFSEEQPSANLLMADSTLRHFVGIPISEELRWLFDTRKKSPNTLPIEPFEGRVYFQANKQLQNTLPPAPTSRILSRMAVYRIWQACLAMIVIAMFLPRKPRVPRAPREPRKTQIEIEPAALLQSESAPDEEPTEESSEPMPEES